MIDSLQNLGFFSWQTAVELAVIWIVVWALFSFIQGTRGAGIIKGFVVLLLVLTVVVQLLTGQNDSFTRLDYLFHRFIELAAILLIVVFQPELRQAIGRLGDLWSMRRSGNVNTVVAEITEAVRFLSRSQFGALIAVERRSRLGGLVESGVELDARVDSRLLENIFWPNSPLHDLGVVIRDDRIVAACVQFPLAEEGMLAMHYGSRHRAGVGLSAESDAVVVIVSEETGKISIAERGRLQTDITIDEFSSALGARLEAVDEDDAADDGGDAVVTEADAAPAAPPADDAPEPVTTREGSS